MSESPNSFDLNGTESPPPSGPDNRGFVLVISILGGLFLLALLIMAAYVVIVLPRNRAQQSTQAAMINLANTSTVTALTQIATQGLKNPATLPPTYTPTKAATLKPSSTPVLAVATSTQLAPGSDVDPRTATVSALLTQAAQAKLTGSPPPTSTALPKTGFAEDVGIPSLLGLTVLLIAVIFIVRRMRSSPA